MWTIQPGFPLLKKSTRVLLQDLVEMVSEKHFAVEYDL
jgi:hypothetical protein